MKYLIILIPIFGMAYTYWSPANALQNGFRVEHICKDGVQIVRFTKGNQFFEQPYCYNVSSYDSDCKHPPIRCYTKEPK